MPMTSPNKIMGKVKSPTFFKGEGKSSTPAKKSNIPVLLAIVLFGAALILFMRSRSTTVSTGPAVNLNAGAAPDQSTIDNLAASINALAGQVHTASPIPAGGTSTPITQIVSNPTPTPATTQVLPRRYSQADVTAQRLFEQAQQASRVFRITEPSKSAGLLAASPQGTFFGAPLGAPSGTISSADANAMYGRLISYIDSLNPNTPNANVTLGLGFSPGAPENKMTVSEYKAKVLGIAGKGGSIDINKGTVFPQLGVR